MNTKRIIFWVSFVVILGLIVWGLIIAMGKPPRDGRGLGTPAAVTTEDHIHGLLTAPVTLIEYSDFQCPACGAYYPIIQKLMASTTQGKLRVVYRHFPLYPLPHPNSMIAAQASEAASNQGKFWEMYELLFAGQKTWADLSRDKAIETFKTYAGTLGLNVVLFGTDLESPTVKARVERNRAEGTALGINSTPTFFLNGRAIVNPQGYDAFKALIDQAAR